MTPSNIGVVIGPNLLWPAGDAGWVRDVTSTRLTVS